MKCQSVCPYCETKSVSGNTKTNHITWNFYCNKFHQDISSDDECLNGYGLIDILEMAVNEDSL